MRIISFISGFLISVILLVAAIAKILRPWDLLVLIDRGGAVFEIFFAIALLLFNQRAWMWLFSSVVFANWAGYSLFWTIQELPCTCMGTLVEVPRGFFLGLGLIFFVSSILLAYFHSWNKQEITWFLLFSLVFGVFGYFFGKWAYIEYVLPTLS